MLRFMILSILAVLAAVSVAHATGGSGDIRRIRSLSIPLDPAASLASNGTVLGLDRLAATNPGKHLSILFVHGIGWTQQRGSDPFGFALVNAIADAYGVSAAGRQIGALCRTSTLDNTTNEAPTGLGGLRIQQLDQSGGRNDPIVLSTDDPATRVVSTDVACVDRIRLALPKGGSITVYRLLWDDTLWNAVEWPHVGYDDPVQRNERGEPVVEPGYENIDGQRRSRNSALKSGLVTYGLTDAAMYIGPVGRLIRAAVRSASCAVISEATGQTRQFADIDEAVKRLGSAPVQADDSRWPVKTVGELCSPRQGGTPAAFAVMSHSLGSRAVFDTFTNNLADDLNAKLDLISNPELEIYMLANQIPLIGVGRLGPKRDAELGSNTPTLNKRLKFVAISELNDLLTYELVPYFEHLYMLRCRGDHTRPAECARNAQQDLSLRKQELATSTTARAAMIKVTCPPPAVPT